MRSFILFAFATMSAAALADTYLTIDFPGATSTDASGINASGVVVGTYTDAGNAIHGFSLEGGTFTTIDYPGATTTSAISINSRGDVSGYFLDVANQYHGFL